MCSLEPGGQTQYRAWAPIWCWNVGILPQAGPWAYIYQGLLEKQISGAGTVRNWFMWSWKLMWIPGKWMPRSSPSPNWESGADVNERLCSSSPKGRRKGQISPLPVSVLLRPQKLGDTIHTRKAVSASLDPNSDSDLPEIPSDMGSCVTGQPTQLQMLESTTGPQPKTGLYFNKDSAWGHGQHCFFYVWVAVMYL